MKQLALCTLFSAVLCTTLDFGHQMYAQTKLCTQEYKPVCGIKDGLMKTYSNKCFAEQDQALEPILEVAIHVE